MYSLPFFNPGILKAVASLLCIATMLAQPFI